MTGVTQPALVRKLSSAPLQHVKSLSLLCNDLKLLPDLQQLCSLPYSKDVSSKVSLRWDDKVQQNKTSVHANTNRENVTAPLESFDFSTNCGRRKWKKEETTGQVCLPTYWSDKQKEITCTSCDNLFIDKDLYSEGGYSSGSCICDLEKPCEGARIQGCSCGARKDPCIRDKLSPNKDIDCSENYSDKAICVTNAITTASCDKGEPGKVSQQLIEDSSECKTTNICSSVASSSIPGGTATSTQATASTLAMNYSTGISKSEERPQSSGLQQQALCHSYSAHQCNQLLNQSLINSSHFILKRTQVSEEKLLLSKRIKSSTSNKKQSDATNFSNHKISHQYSQTESLRQLSAPLYQNDTLNKSLVTNPGPTKALVKNPQVHEAPLSVNSFYTTSPSKVLVASSSEAWPTPTKVIVTNSSAHSQAPPVNSLWLVIIILLCTLLPAPTQAVINTGNPDAKRLYDDLLSNYNKLVRPVQNTTDPLTVRIKLKLSQLIDVVSSKLFI
jgi:hypothetical protein